MMLSQGQTVKTQPDCKITGLLMIRWTLLMLALILASLAAQAGSDGDDLEYRHTNATRILAMPFGNDNSSNTFNKNPKNAAQITLVDQLKTELKHYIGTPMYTLFQGKYKGGVDKYTEGMAYKAEWNKKGVSFELKYQF